MAYTNHTGQSSIQPSRKYNRVTCNVRLPSYAYHGGYARLKDWLQQSLATERPLSNSMTFRLALHALERLKNQATQAGPEAVQILTDDLKAEMQRMRAGSGTA